MTTAPSSRVYGFNLKENMGSFQPTKSGLQLGETTMRLAYWHSPAEIDSGYPLASAKVSILTVDTNLPAASGSLKLMHLSLRSSHWTLCRLHIPFRFVHTS